METVHSYTPDVDAMDQWMINNLTRGLFDFTAWASVAKLAELTSVMNATMIHPMHAKLAAPKDWLHNCMRILL